MTKGPILIDLEDEAADAALDVAAAEPVLDTTPAARAAVMLARRRSKLAGWFWALAGMLAAGLFSVAAWQAVTSLMSAVPILGILLTVLAVAFGLVAVLVALRELRAILRLSRLGGLRETIADAQDLISLRRSLEPVERLYTGRADMAWGLERWRAAKGDELDMSSLVLTAEDCLMSPLDKQALAEVESSARRVATVTALVPLGLVDIVVAGLTALRMIRRIGEIYGGRGGTLGSVRLARSVVLHLAATGAMAMADDVLEPVLGGTVLSKLSRRFGEGLVNGALTVRVGLAAIELCRPLPFADGHKPSTRAVIGRALAGIFSKPD